MATVHSAGPAAWVFSLAMVLCVAVGCYPPSVPSTAQEIHAAPAETEVLLSGTPFTNSALRLGQVVRWPGAVRVSTLAGAGRPGPLGGGYADGPAVEALFHEPTGIEAGPNGGLYVSDWINHRIRWISADGMVSTVAGGGAPGPQGAYADGRGAEARFDGPEGLALAPQGALVVADSRNHRLRQVAANGDVTTFAGGGAGGFLGGYVDGPADLARFSWPLDVAVDGTGRVYVADFNNHAIRLITPNGRVSTLAGAGLPGYQDASGSTAAFNTPNRLAFAPDGSLIVSEGAGFYGGGGHRIRRVTQDGWVTTVAGAGQRGYRDGPAGQALFNIPQGVAVDSMGVIYVADSGNHVIRRIGLDGEVTTLAGSGASGFQDGDGVSAQFWYPSDLVWLPDGYLVVADRLNHRVRLVSLDG